LSFRSTPSSAGNSRPAVSPSVYILLEGGPYNRWEDPAALRAHREAFCAAIREYNAGGASARNWTVQFVIRHSAYHLLDHAWEMEDRDLSGGS
jgi:hypothetical protein